MECRFSSSSIERSDVVEPASGAFSFSEATARRTSLCVGSARRVLCVRHESRTVVWEPAMGQNPCSAECDCRAVLLRPPGPLLELSFTELQVRAVQRVAVELIARDVRT